MLCGVVVGYIFRHRSLTLLPKVITSLILVLLFILGIEVGSNEAIVTNLHSLGVEAVIITLLSVLGSVVGALFLWLWVKDNMN